jgi:hypothetical protein
MRISNLLGSMVLVLGFVSSASAASAEHKGWVGALGGLSVPNQDNTTSRLMYGITGGAKLGSEYGLGAYFLTASKDEGTPVGTFTYDMYGVEFGYHFEGEAEGAFFGARVGTSKVKAGSVSGSPTNYGAFGGYNHFLSDAFSIGGEVDFFSLSSANGIDGFTMLNFLGSAKFWF